LESRNGPPPEPVLGDPKFELRLTEFKSDVGSIPITWCVDRDWLFKNSDSEQYVLLSVAPPEKGGDKAEWRGWAKLSDMMAYVTFYRPGKNRILARVTPTKKQIGWSAPVTVVTGKGVLWIFQSHTMKKIASIY